jgi:hypothetical protein
VEGNLLLTGGRGLEGVTEKGICCAMGIRIVVLHDMCVAEQITPGLVPADCCLYSKEKIILGVGLI